MRSAVLIALAIFIAVLATGYSIAWYAQARNARSALEQVIARINGAQKYITYDAIETSGFPGDLYVTITRPHFSGRLDQLLKDTGGDPQATPPEFNEDAVLDGRIVLGLNALSSHYSLRISGNWRENATAGGQAMALLHRQDGDIACDLQLTPGGGLFAPLWDYQSLARDPQAFLKDLRLFDCAAPAGMLSDAQTGEALATSGPSRLYMTSTPQGTQQQMRFYAKIADMEIAPGGDKIIAAYYALLAPKRLMPPKFSIYGKQNAEIDFSYNGPADWQGETKNPPLNIALSKCDLTNRMYDYHATFFLANGMEGDRRVSSITLNATADFSDQHSALMQELARGIIQQLYAEKRPQFHDMQTLVQKYTPDELYAIVAPAIPDLHSLGKMAQSLDLHFQGTPEFSAGEISLNDLELSTTPYGITGNGTANLTAGKPPVANIALACRNCARMIDDMAAYASRFQAMMRALNPEKAAAFTFNAKTAEGMKSFLAALAAPPNQGTFNYAITSDEASGMAVNGKRMDQVLALYGQYVTPAMKEPARQNDTH